MRSESLAAILCLALAVSVSAGPANSQGQGAGKRPYPPGLSEALLIQQRADALGLSEATQTKLQALIDEAKTDGEQLAKESAEATTKLRKLLDEPLPDESPLLKAGDETGKVAKRMREQRLKTTLRARALLTEEQLTSYMEIRSRVAVPRPGAGRGRR
jgi:Spy/CpxP family protein refolding chaperone